MSGSSSRSETARCIVLACLLWAGSAAALDPTLDASQYGHTAWRISEGFSQARISSFAQGPDGYLWIGTESGLLRFDGVRTLPWVPPPGTQLPSDHVRLLVAARDGLLWIGTLSGLAAWDGRKLATHPKFDASVINALHEDREGTLWVGATPLSSEAPGLLCAVRGATTECHASVGLGITSVLEQSNGVLWAAGVDRVWRWKPGPQIAYSLRDYTVSLQTLGETESGALIVGTRTGIRTIRDGRVERYSLPGTERKLLVTALLRDRDGALWIGTRDAGLVHVHGGRTDFFAGAQGLSGDHVTRLFEDREGNIWVGTLDGMDRFRALSAASYGKPQGVFGSASVLRARDGSIWVSTQEGLKTWRGERFVDPDVRGLPKGVRPASLFQDSSGRIWVGSPSGLGYVEHGTYTSVNGVPGGFIDSFAEDNDGNLWLAHRDRGVLRISRDGRIDSPWEKKSLFLRRLAADPVRGGIWIGSFSEGLVHFADGRIAASYSIPDQQGTGFISQVSVAAAGTVWVANTKGLSRIKNDRIATLGSRDGLPCDAVHWMIEDAEHTWWLYMGCGVVRVAQSELDAWAAAVDAGKAPRRIVAATMLSSSDGVRNFQNPGTFSPQAARSGDGKLWFVGSDGLTLVDPRRRLVNQQPPPVHVEGLVADRKAYEASSSVRLPPLVRDLEIQYTATSLVAPEKMQFKYKLEGRDRDWNDAGNRRQAFYADLEPGDYRFRVIASNNSGVWNEKGALLEFSVAPAYWQTWWFRALCLIVIGMLLWALYRWRVRQIAREFSLTLDARVAERTRIARELHDTLLQGFHGVLLRFQTALELLPHRAGEAKQVLASTIDQAAAAITEGRDAVQGLRASATETNDLAESIRTFADELAAEGGGKCAVRMEVLGAPRPMHPIVRDEIFRIAAEALRNAFRHAGAQRIEMELRYDQRQLRLGVRDDGRGIQPEVLSAGGREGHFGLHGMRERAKLIGGKLTVWSAAEAGTEIELAIPAANAYAAIGQMESAA